MVRKDYSRGGMVIQTPVAIVVVEIAIVLAEVDEEKPKVGIGFGIEEMVLW